MHNQFFAEYKVKALCKDFITFLARMKEMRGSDRGIQPYYENVQVAVPVSCIQSVTEIPDGVRIGTVEGRYTKQYDVPEAHIKMVSEAIRRAQTFAYREREEWMNQ